MSECDCIQKSKVTEEIMQLAVMCYGTVLNAELSLE